MDKAVKIVDRKPIVCPVHEVRCDFRQHFGIAANHVGHMGNDITSRVKHLPFVHHVVDFLMLEAQPPLQQVVAIGIDTFVVKVIDLGIEAVAGVFGQRAHLMVFNQLTELLVADGGVAYAKEILFAKVVVFGLVGRISRCYPLQVQVFGRLIRQGQSTKSHGIVIDFLSVEKHVDLQRDVDGTRVDLGVLRDELVAIL